MARSSFYFIFVAALSLLIGSCSSDVSRNYIQDTDPSFSVAPIVAPNALSFMIVDQIDDGGNHQVRISITLKNSADDSGKAWSDIFGPKMTVQVGGQNFTLDLKD